MQESNGGPGEELQRTSGLYEATTTFNLLSPPIAFLSAYLRTRRSNVDVLSAPL